MIDFYCTDLYRYNVYYCRVIAVNGACVESVRIRVYTGITAVHYTTHPCILVYNIHARMCGF